MPVITVNGEIGSGAREMAPLVAQYAGMDFVDRLVLAEAGRRLRASVGALADKEQRIPPLRERVTRLLQAALERSATTGGAGDPFFQPSVEALLVTPYPETSREPITAAQELDNRRFVDVLAQVVKDLARDSNVVIVGRASNIVLKDWPDAFHVATVAPLAYRVQTIIKREGMSQADAEKLIAVQERARLAYHRRFYRVEANDPLNYHLIINIAQTGVEPAARAVVEMAKSKLKG